MRFKDLTGQKFGRWIVTKRSKKYTNNKIHWICICSCSLKTVKTIAGSSLIKGYSTSCGCYMKEQIHKRLYTGTKDISRVYFSNIKIGAKKRKIKFNLTIEQLQQLLEDQNYKCALTGINIYGSKSIIKTCSSYSEMTASLDRIDSSLDYTIDNVWWIHKDINKMKNDISLQDFIKNCRLVTQYNKD